MLWKFPLMIRSDNGGRKLTVRSIATAIVFIFSLAAGAAAAPIPITEIAAKLHKPLDAGTVYQKTPTVQVMVEFGVASWYHCPTKPEQVDNPKLGIRDAIYPIAHKTLPFGTLVKVINPANGKKILARVVDRGPFIAGRIIDLDQHGAKALGIGGIGRVITKIYKVDYDQLAQAR